MQTIEGGSRKITMIERAVKSKNTNFPPFLKKNEYLFALLTKINFAALSVEYAY